MNKHTIPLISFLLLILLAGALLVSCGKSSSSSSSASDGQSLMQERCSVCHSLNRTISKHKTAAQWTTTVQRMVKHGAKLDSQEQLTLIDFLSANY